MSLNNHLLIVGMVVLFISASLSGCVVNNDRESDTLQEGWIPEYGVNYSVNVTYVVDGDTFDAVFPSGNEERIRLLGVDVPETTPSKNDEYEYGNITDLDCLAIYGIESKVFAKSRLDGKTVMIQFDETAGLKGYYGRWLAYVFLTNGTDFNAELVKNGYARAYDEGTCEKESYYIELQSQALSQRVGLWNCISDASTNHDTDNTTTNSDINHPPTADFAYGTNELQVIFSDNSNDEDGDDLTYIWNFGDETTSYEQNPSHTYSFSKKYTVSLTVSDGKTSDTKTQEITVRLIVEGDFSIASWNLQVFGPTKASNETLLNYYADKLDEYDLFIVQEIRDISGTAIEALASKLPAYTYIISERAGRSSSKEQYAIFYNNRALLLETTDWTSEKQNEFERPPFEATFKVNDWTFTLFIIHTKPTDVYNELTYLETLIGTPDDDTIVIGDLNADGSYYDEDNIVHFTTWNWMITNDMDTTVAVSDNTYDRIIINDDTENNFISSGVMDDVVSSQSDHYLVYGVFNPDES